MHVHVYAQGFEGQRSTLSTLGVILNYRSPSFWRQGILLSLERTAFQCHTTGAFQAGGQVRQEGSQSLSFSNGSGMAQHGHSCPLQGEH